MQAVAVVSGDFVRTGGMDMPNYALARRLAELGAPTHVVAHRVADDLVKKAGIVWHRVAKPLNSYMCGAPFLDMAGRRVARLVQGLSGRVVVNGGNCQVHDVNWVHYVHAAYDPQPQSAAFRWAKAVVERPINLATERAALGKAELVIANSDRTRRDLEQLLGVDGSRIRTVYLGIDPGRFAPADTERRARCRARLGLNERPKVVFVGALGDQRKGFDTLYAAWSELCARPSWDCDLIVVGRGADLDGWRARARNDGLQGRIDFLGFRSDVPDILAACDALAAPTRYEAYGLGVHEALCCGLPAIVSADAGVAERFLPELRELLLQDPNSASELVERLDHWRSGIERFRASTLALASTLRDRTWDTMADEIISLLQHPVPIRVGAVADGVKTQEAPRAVACYTPQMQAVAVVSGDFVRTGGMDMPNYALARRLAELGAPTHIVAHRIADDLVKEAGVVWHRVAKPLNSYMCGAPFLDMAGRRVARIVQGASGRVVVNGGNCQVHDVNWVHYVHAAFEPQPTGAAFRWAKAAVERPLNLASERAALSKAQLVIANSERTSRDLQDRLGIDPARIRTIYYGIDPVRFAPADAERRARCRALLELNERPKVVFVGALGDQRKGFDTLYAAWSELCAKPSWDCDLMVVGRGANLDVWRARARDDRMDERIQFLGFRSDVPDILAACDALVAPTRYEAYGLGVQEALCCGLPSIVSADAGVAERFPAELSELLLQDPNSATELVQRLDRWRGNMERFRTHTLALSVSLRQRDWGSMADEIIALLS